MKKIIKRIAALTLALLLLAMPAAAFADTGYTYNYDYWDEVQYSPDAYAVRTTITYKELGLDKKFHIHLCARQHTVYL